TAWVNQHMSMSAKVPFGGVKWSGLGRENGKWGIEEFCELQVVNAARALAGERPDPAAARCPAHGTALGRTSVPDRRVANRRRGPGGPSSHVRPRWVGRRRSAVP